MDGAGESSGRKWRELYLNNKNIYNKKVRDAQNLKFAELVKAILTLSSGEKYALNMIHYLNKSAKAL